ncbi:N-acetylmuramoyl-L-alanine amidase [Sporolactobacillus shoreicorticis]|uniref:N-acetylmuramoyl-L-alanine amidase n=1 Tax=Sporolactobacillus shoreicorticis TaxID=1923877 RepID=A0ABW5SAQ6_9BACL|nr:N-acetylmuramoyl-L-alanine amidase [Sporolactobacillus shoreicorticis]MCO7125447.1 N-acetylmuramoyl-L-alanine amidase [Sporolactobacillus shoreicorticis]
MIIHLDAGHGGKDSGAVGNGLKEKDITLALAKTVRTILEKDYINLVVNMTRTTDTFVALSRRAELVNKENADYFFSIHVNAGGGTGYEDYIYNQSSTGGATDIARTKIHNAVLPVLKKYNLVDRGKKKANDAVLRETKMRAMLAETLFIDTQSDANYLKNPTFLNDIAYAYAKGLASIVGATRKNETSEEINTTTYLVQIGAFKNRKNAELLVKKAEKAGFKPFIKMK